MENELLLLMNFIYEKNKDIFQTEYSYFHHWYIREWSLPGIKSDQMVDSALISNAI